MKSFMMKISFKLTLLAMVHLAMVHHRPAKYGIQQFKTVITEIYLFLIKISQIILKNANTTPHMVHSGY